MKIRSAVVMAVLSLVALAQETRSRRVVEELNQLCTAMLQENYARAVDLMHPKVILYFGGREKAIAAFRSEADSMKAEGLVATAARAGSPLGFWTGGSDLFTLVPAFEEARFRGGRLSWKAHYIGISSDQGKSWVFVPSLAFQDDKAKYLKEFFPNWPTALQLPPRERAKLPN